MNVLEPPDLKTVRSDATNAVIRNRAEVRRELRKIGEPCDIRRKAAVETHVRKASRHWVQSARMDTTFRFRGRRVGRLVAWEGTATIGAADAGGKRAASDDQKRWTPAR